MQALRLQHLQVTTKPVHPRLLQLECHLWVAIHPTSDSPDGREQVAGREEQPREAYIQDFKVMKLCSNFLQPWV